MKGARIALLASVLALTLACTSAMAFERGASYHCPAVGADPAVGIWIGRIDQNDVDAVASVSIWPLGNSDEPTVGHAPFGVAALAQCTSTIASPDKIDRIQFEEGYAIWRTAFDKDEAGAWSISPSEVYRTILGVLTHDNT